MCSESFKNGPQVGECTDCGAPVDEDGAVICGCCYAPVVCETCGDAPCVESC